MLLRETHGYHGVFGRFERGDNVVGRISGTGVGLASARQIVEQHGGTITVESQEGAGSASIVWLPLGAAAAGTGSAVAGHHARRDVY